MSTPILATKLYIPPPRPNLVRRPRLIERLNAGLHQPHGFSRKLTLISAPAGFGKTTLVSNWVNDLRFQINDLRLDAVESQIVNQQSKIVNQIAWLSLDERDNDPVRFLTYLVAALQTVAPRLGEGVLGALQSPQPPPVETMLTTLLNEIVTLPDHFVLVLDDYHVIDANSIDASTSVDGALTFLLEHLPPQMHLVIATRADPQLPLARYRARGQLSELRAADLRFTPAEAAAFLNGVMGLTLATEDIAALETRTEGWIAGLQLAAISMQGHNDASGFIQSFTGSHRFVLDYLVEEVLHQQPERIQNFLLCTSILDRLCGPLCDAVLLAPTASGQETLEYLEQANLFIVPLDNERRWYRYHHLFADLLRQRLPQSTAPSLGGKGVAEYHSRASLWYEENGMKVEAFHHALAAAEFERAAALVELAWSAMDRSRQSAMWLEWVQALPDELIRARPVLSVGYAWALLDSGELEAGEARLRDAERWLHTSSDVRERAEAPAAEMVVTDEEEFRSLPATIAAARAYRALALGDMPGTVQYARRALDLLPQEDHLRRGIPASLLGLAYWTSGDLEAAHHAFAAAMASFQMAGNILFAITGTHVLADIRMAQGRLREAVRTYDQSLQLATAEGGPVLRGAADLYTRLSELHCEQDDLTAATQHLQRSKELGEKAALPRWQYRWCVARARIQEAQGDLDGALDLLDEAERLYIRGPVPDVRPIAALKTRLWIAQGRLTTALDWARARDLSVDDDFSYMNEFEYITLARLFIAQYKSEGKESLIAEAMGLLARLLQAAEEGGRTGSALEILVLQALAHAAQGDIPPALVPLERALALAQPEGYVRIFVDEGAPMARLLSAAAARGIMPTYTGELLAAMGDGTNDSSRSGRLRRQRPMTNDQRRRTKDEGRTTAPSPSSLIEPLSPRELEVLQLVAQGLSNREISERLFLALSTVKGHNRNIYGKLQVKRRTEAVVRARELGLL